MNNLDAFLTAIATSEGTLQIPGGDNGYKVIVGSTPGRPILMDSYADHPRQLVQLRLGLASTAAGRYQVLERFYDAYKVSLGLPDFSPTSQDRIAIQMIREHDAIRDIVIGNFNVAVTKCADIWASLPGSGYGQRENTLTALRNTYTQAGGKLV